MDNLLRVVMFNQMQFAIPRYYIILFDWDELTKLELISNVAAC